MSSGLMGFATHAAVLETLIDNGLTPASVSGSSSGGAVAGLWAAGLEPGRIVEEIVNLQRRDFWDPAPGFGLLRGDRAAEKMRSLLPVAKIEECAVPLEISVFDAKSRRNEVLTQGDLPLGLVATCALPGLVQPIMIDGRPKLDGGIKDWAGFAGAESDERIFHHRLASRLSKYIPFNSQTRPVFRPNLQTLAIDGVPLVTPFSLHRSIEAYQHAKTGAVEALDRPIVSPTLI